MKSYKMSLKVSGQIGWFDRFVKFYTEVRKIAPKSWGDYIELNDEKQKEIILECAKKHRIILFLDEQE